MTEAVRLTQDNLPKGQAPEVRQRAASDPDASVWVNASAGSGKTTVLTNRVTRLLLDGVQPQRILCLTFTRAAAAEMAIRVTDKLSHWATCDDNTLSKSIAELQGEAPDPKQMTAARRLFARVLACPGGMRIRTIHAFCQEILRRFPIEAGLAPHFAVIEDNDARALREDAQQDLLRMAAAEPDSALGRALQILVCDLGERGFGDAMRSILGESARLNAAVAKAGSLEKLIAQMRSELSLAPDETTKSICADTIDEHVLPTADVRQAAQWLLEGSKMYAPRGERLLAWLALPSVERAAKFEDYYRCFFKDDGEPYQNFGNKELLAKYPDLAAILGREAVRLQAVRERLEAAHIAENTAAVLTFGSFLIRRYEERKAAQAVLDYDDLITRTNELLRRAGIAPWVLYKLDGGLDHILVDEAQDTSRAQWSIVAALADEFFAGAGARSDQNRTLFVVGDEKQSIFSFQRADPEAFIEMRGYFSGRIADAEKQYREVPLHISFRSAPAVLQAVDAVFADPRVQSGVSSEAVSHIPAPPRLEEPEKVGRVEVWPLLPAPKKDEAEEGSWPLPLGYEAEHDPQAELAHQIAGKIKVWLTDGENLSGYERPIAAGDIMILLRRRGRFADLMVRALKEKNVPVTGVDRMRLVKQLPVMDLLALMQFALLPEDDLNLATVLRGPLLNLSEDELMAVAMNREGTLWHSLAGKTGDKPAFAAAQGYLSGLLSAADFITPFAFLARILSQPCPGSDVSGRRAIWSRLGPDALGPIDELLNAAQDFSHRHAPSLQNFLHWLMATEAEIKRELDRGGGQVRIMTVHAAKGLEAPIVFLPDTASVPRLQDMPRFLWSDEDVPFYVPRKPKASVAKNLWDAARQKQMEEYRRLLYVALTRAAGRLYIAGWESVRKEPNSNESWYNLVFAALKPLNQLAATVTEPYPDIVFADPELRAAKKKTPAKKIAAKPVQLPAWIRKPAPDEKPALKPVAPSHLAQGATTPDRVFTRGRIIHRLLQSLPDVEESKRDAVAMKFLANPQHRLTPEQQAETKKEVMNLLCDPDFVLLFGAGSRAEVPLVGRIGGQEISGQVDRLYVGKDEIRIIDYKTNRPPPEDVADVDQTYIRQLAAYRAVLQDIYPDRPIRCFLLWTYGPRLMEVPETALAGA